MANDTFKHLNADKLYASSDGQFFTDENRAVLHATPNKLKVFVLVVPEQDLTETVEPIEPVIDDKEQPETDNEQKKTVDTVEPIEPVVEKTEAPVSDEKKAVAKKTTKKK